ncbi:MAG: radical SAM protein [Chloroflexi bacterium]|nr:radical SAM protein [Chloroflexota bacterium]
MPIVELITLDGQRLIVNARREAITLMVNDDLTLTYDHEGRLVGAWMDGRNYRRSLDNRVIEKQEGPQPGLSYRVRRELPEADARELLTRVYALTEQYRGWLADPASRVTNNSSPTDGALARDALDRIIANGTARLERDRDIFHVIYKPITILPPDQYLALVLQATEGCSYNHCAFCSFYRDRKFRVKTLAEFKHHVRDVRAFFGGALSLRKTIFLADANALIIPREQLVPIFDSINADFEIHPRGLDYEALKAWEVERPIHFEGIYSFIDAFTTRRKTAREYTELAERGLRRVYIGMETGDEDLLRFLGKPNSPYEVVQLAHHLKAGGVAVSVIILVGAGGDKYADQHVQHTIDLVNAMPLDASDLIYFSELVDYPDSVYSALARAENIRPLTVHEIAQQMAQMRAGFRFRNLDRAPKISFYDIREFIY